MTKAELMEAWVGIPGNAEIIVEADHGQTPEFANSIEITQEDTDDNFELEEVRWKNITPKTKVERVTAILIR